MKPTRARMSAFASEVAGHRLISRRLRRAGGATPIGAATWSEIPEYWHQFELAGGVSFRF